MPVVTLFSLKVAWSGKSHINLHGETLTVWVHSGDVMWVGAGVGGWGARGEVLGGGGVEGGCSL